MTHAYARYDGLEGIRERRMMGMMSEQENTDSAKDRLDMPSGEQAKGKSLSKKLDDQTKDLRERLIALAGADKENPYAKEADKVGKAMDDLLNSQANEGADRIGELQAKLTTVFDVIHDAEVTLKEGLREQANPLNFKDLGGRRYTFELPKASMQSEGPLISYEGTETGHYVNCRGQSILGQRSISADSHTWFAPGQDRNNYFSRSIRGEKCVYEIYRPNFKGNFQIIVGGTIVNTAKGVQEPERMRSTDMSKAEQQELLQEFGNRSDQGSRKDGKKAGPEQGDQEELITRTENRLQILKNLKEGNGELSVVLPQMQTYANAHLNPLLHRLKAKNTQTYNDFLRKSGLADSLLLPFATDNIRIFLRDDDICVEFENTKDRANRQASELADLIQNANAKNQSIQEGLLNLELGRINASSAEFLAKGGDVKELGAVRALDGKQFKKLIEQHALLNMKIVVENGTLSAVREPVPPKKEAEKGKKKEDGNTQVPPAEQPAKPPPIEPIEKAPREERPEPLAKPLEENPPEPETKPETTLEGGILSLGKNLGFADLRVLAAKEHHAAIAKDFQRLEKNLREAVNDYPTKAPEFRAMIHMAVDVSDAKPGVRKTESGIQMIVITPNQTAVEMQQTIESALQKFGIKDLKNYRHPSVPNKEEGDKVVKDRLENHCTCLQNVLGLEKLLLWAKSDNHRDIDDTSKVITENMTRALEGFSAEQKAKMSLALDLPGTAGLVVIDKGTNVIALSYDQTAEQMKGTIESALSSLHSNKTKK